MCLCHQNFSTLLRTNFSKLAKSVHLRNSWFSRSWVTVTAGPIEKACWQYRGHTIHPLILVSSSLIHLLRMVGGWFPNDCQDYVRKSLSAGYKIQASPFIHIFSTLVYLLRMMRRWLLSIFKVTVTARSKVIVTAGHDRKKFISTTQSTSFILISLVHLLSLMWEWSLLILKVTGLA